MWFCLLTETGLNLVSFQKVIDTCTLFQAGKLPLRKHDPLQQRVDKNNSLVDKKSDFPENLLACCARSFLRNWEVTLEEFDEDERFASLGKEHLNQAVVECNTIFKTEFRLVLDFVVDYVVNYGQDIDEQFLTKKKIGKLFGEPGSILGVCTLEMICVALLALLDILKLLNSSRSVRSSRNTVQE